MPSHFPVSIKGVLIEKEAVLLLENERNEWELPGGRLEEGETPQACLMREFREETGATVQIGRLAEAWVFEVLPGRQVFIIAYKVSRHGNGSLTLSHEHKRMAWWPLAALPAGALPLGYQSAIESACRL